MAVRVNALRRVIYFLTLSFALTGPVAAKALVKETPGPVLLTLKATELASRISEKPEVKDLFDRSFFRYISLEKTQEIIRQVYRIRGKVIAVRLENADSAFSGHYVFETEKGFFVPVALSLNEETGRLSGMYFQQAYPKNLSLASISRQFSALPGRAGFALVRLGSTTAIVEALNENIMFSAGTSAFLYMLGAAVIEGYSWSKVLKLGPSDLGNKESRLAAWPPGSPLTLHSLASFMTAENDPVAADTILEVFGREEAQDAAVKMGHSSPELLTPFLKYSEARYLKNNTAANLAYMNSGLKEKRRLLEKISAQNVLPAADKASTFGVTKADWPLSPLDLCRAMDYFRVKNESVPLDILALNKGLDFPAAKFLYSGYKGGTGPGIFNGSWLLQTRKGEWFCLAGMWNATPETITPADFTALMQAAVNELGK